MGGSFVMTVGNKGRIVLPAEVRARHGWSEGTTLIAVETDSGITVVERSEALGLVRAELAGTNVVEELLAERRAEAARDDAEDAGTA